VPTGISIVAKAGDRSRADEGVRYTFSRRELRQVQLIRR
jgi:hypothetical protein